MNHHIRVLVAVALAVSFLSSVPIRAQTLNPSYLSEMPSPAKILSEIKGKDAEDTAERQMGAFKHLMEIIDSMAYGLEHRFLPNKATPDESRIKEAYWKAYADVWYKARRRDDHYIHDWDLHDEMMAKFFSKGFRELLLKSDKNRSAIYDKHREESAGEVFTVGPKDQPAEGVEDLLKSGLKRLSQSLTPEPVTPGLVLRGFYRTPKFYANFWGANFLKVGCSGVNRNSSYTLERKGGQILVHIENDDDTVTLALRPDLALVGPGPLAIHGFVPGGSTTVTTPGEARQVTTTKQVEMNRTDVMSAGQQQNATQTGAQTYTVPQTTTSTEYTPPTTTTTPAPFLPKTVRCLAGTITPEPAAKPSNAPKEESTGLLKVVADALGGEEVYVPNGLRMAGTYYGPGGANIEFLEEKAIVGCNVTRDENPYTVASRNGEVIVNVEGAGAPLAFKLNLDGTLIGNGASIPIYGRKFVGKDQKGDPVYTSSSDTCAYGNLSPRGPSQAPAAPAVTATAPVVKNSPISNSTTTAADTPVLTVNNGFIGQAANPLAGRELLVLKASFEEALRKAGFQDPATAPVKRSAVTIWAAACKAQSPMCKQGIDALQPFYVGKLRLDGSGTVKVSGVPKGNFWVLGLGAANGQHFVWDLPLEIKPGANSIALDPRNAKVIY